MPPFGGEGANQAMLDAAELARSPAWDEAVAQYEAEMFARVAEAAAGAAEGAATFLSHDGQVLMREHHLRRGSKPGSEP